MEGNIEILGERYFSRQSLAKELGISEQTLACWVTQRKGPTKTKIGKKVLYRASSVRGWLERNTK